MKQLDEGTRRALLAGQDPPAGAQERVLRAILAAGPPGGGGEPSGGGPSGGGAGAELVTATGRGLELAFAAKLVGATIGLTTAGLVTLALASAGVRSLRADPPTHARTHAVEVAERDEPAPPPIQTFVREPVATPEPESSPAPREASPPSPKSSQGSGSSRASVPATTSLEAELALMQAARDAKASATKLELLERHAREFGQGVLADEREVLRVETLCALGRKVDAEALAAAFVAAKPSNPLRSRVEPACGK